MPFSSAVFLMLFLPGTMLLYFLGGMGERHRSYKNAILLIASILFYAWGEPVFVFIMLGSVVVNYGAGLAIERYASQKKKILIASLVFNIGILFVFKYLSFVTRNLHALLSTPVLQIALPIGISFYTFQIMSYVFDVYYGKTPAQHNLFRLALYITMFPQLIAGPIVRYETVAREIETRRETADDVAYGITRFVIGLAKKVLLADFLGAVADSVFTVVEYTTVAPLTAWIGIIAYAYELYYDFSGYSDMAIGLGRCLGFHFLENFNYPYMAKSISDYWRRWHLSLTSWFRDYVYIPLGGNRKGPRRRLLNLFIVWLLTGIWHGAEWTFIVWGLIQFVLQTVERKWRYPEKLPRFLAWLYTMVVICLWLIIFRAPDLSVAVTYYKNMFTFANGWYDAQSMAYLSNIAVVLVLAIIGSFPVFPYLRERMEGTQTGASVYACGRLCATIGLLVVSLLVVINGSYSPFIYFNF